MGDKAGFKIRGYPKPPLFQGKKREAPIEVAVLLAIFAFLWALLWLGSSWPLVGVAAVAVMGALLSLPDSVSDRAARRVSRTVVVLALVGFLALMVGELLLGGSALNGKVEGEQCYVGSHGRFSPVPKGVYILSASIDSLTMALWPSLFCMPLLEHLIRRRRPPPAQPLDRPYRD
ncbi:MAG TPA: hypothetical protein VIU40_15230 [Geobacteraceae bacterium]